MALAQVSEHKFQTKTQIKALLADAGIHPRRRRGQHFLIDGNLMRRLVTSADIQPDDTVLEVGPGTGSLTEALLARAGRLIVVEVDRALHDIVRGRIGDDPKVRLIHADILASKHRIAPQVIEALADARGAAAGRLMLVSNLPYDVATPVLMNLLTCPLGFDRYCATVQREMADRIKAAPSTKDFGPVSVVAQGTCRITRVAALPPAAFWPRPAVESTMLRLDHQVNPFETPERLNQFQALLRAAFAHRRKTLRSNLLHVVDEDVCRTLADEFDLGRRPEDLTVAEWVALGRRVDALSGS